MPTTFYTVDSVIAGNRFLPTGDNQDAVVTAKVLVASTGGSGLVAFGSYHDVVVYGQVVAEAFGIRLGDQPSAHVYNSVTIAAGGSARGGLVGVDLFGQYSHLTNEGSIIADNVTGMGVAVAGIGTGTSILANSGSIVAGIGISVRAGATETLKTVNHGRIEGSKEAYSSVLGSNADWIINRGLIQGDIQLGAQDDVYDGRGGRMELGEVYGGDGNDTFLPGAHEEIIDGGAGTDTIDLRGSLGGRASLLDESGSGRADGDLYAHIERVLGSRTAADTLVGSGVDNTLAGFAGNDVLIGNAGADRLVGGDGNDSFRYNAPTDGGDVIPDFGNAHENDDRFVMKASAFGGLTAGVPLASHQFQSRADNVAQDSDDRFVFRTTDQTLWYDADGIGGGSPVLIADLQDGAVVTAADILLV